MAHPDDQGLPLPGPQLPDHRVQRLGGLLGVPGRADRQRVPVRPQARGGGEVQLGPGRVDQVVVTDPDLLAGPAWKGGDDVHRGLPAVALSLRPDRDRPGLMERDALAPVHRRQRERHLLRGHPADPDPDVRRDPVPVRIRRHDHHLVVLAQQPPQMQGSGVPRNPGSENHHTRHDLPPSERSRARHRALSPAYPQGYRYRKLTPGFRCWSGTCSGSAGRLQDRALQRRGPVPGQDGLIREIPSWVYP